MGKISTWRDFCDYSRACFKNALAFGAEASFHRKFPTRESFAREAYRIAAGEYDDDLAKGCEGFARHYVAAQSGRRENAKAVSHRVWRGLKRDEAFAVDWRALYLDAGYMGMVDELTSDYKRAHHGDLADEAARLDLQLRHQICNEDTDEVLRIHTLCDLLVLAAYADYGTCEILCDDMDGDCSLPAYERILTLVTRRYEGVAAQINAAL